MAEKITFTKIAKFKMDGKTFVRFNNKKLGDAYLRLNDVGKFILPSTEEFAKIINVFYVKESRDIFQMSFDLKRNHKKYSFIPKLKHKGKALILTSAIALSLLQGCGIEDRDVLASNNNAYHSESIQEMLSASYNSPSTDDYNPYEEEKYNSSENAERPFDVDFEGDTYIRVNNSELFDEIFNKDNASIEDIYKAIDRNNKIPKDYKSFMKEYFTELNNYYDDLELRVFEYNLKTLDVQTKPSEEIQWDVKNEYGVAYWDAKSNVIVISDNFDYVNNPWDLATLRHELGHLGNYFYIQQGDYSYKYQFKAAGVGEYTMEALNVVFTTEPYMEYYESVGQDNVGYPLISNELRTILSCIDYSPKDSIDHNVYLLEEKMDEVMSDVLDAHVILGIIDMQQTENVDQVIELDEQDYKDLYSYITTLYIRKYVNSDMSYSEITQIRDDLKANLLKGVHNPEYVYVDVVDEVFDTYMLENNIQQGLSK